MKTIEEIMGLVNTIQKNRVCAEMSPSNKEYFNSVADEAFKAIESALRELVERKPLSDEEFSEMESECWSNTVDKGKTQFDFVKLLKDKIEAHHKIGA